MATLAEQLESALEGTGSAMSASDIGEMLSGTSTSIQPGTITPITSQQSNQLSWNNVFKKISEGVQLQPGEGLPEVPKNIPASTFYRTATQAGSLPTGASQFFTKPLAPETPTIATQAPQTTATTTPQTTGTTTQRAVQQIQEAVDLGGDSDINVEDPFSDYLDDRSAYGSDFNNLESASLDKETGKVTPGLFDIGLQEQVDINAALAEEATPKNIEEYSAEMTKVDSAPGRTLDSTSIYDQINRAALEASTLDVSGKGPLSKAGQYAMDLYFGDPLGTHAKDSEAERMKAQPFMGTPIKGFTKFDQATSFFKDQFAKQMEPINFTATSLGMLTGAPLGAANVLLQAVMSEGHGQIGRTGIVSDIYWNPGGAGLGPAVGTQIAGFANVPGSTFSIAVDALGRQVVDRTGVNIYGVGNTKKGQEAYNKLQANKARDEYEAANPYGSVDEQAAAAEASAAQNMADAIAGYSGQSDHTETAESGDPTGDKIICTMMNRMYGLGNYRAKQWLLYSNRYLTPEHQLGYHKLYYKLVSMMPSNKLIAKVLSHIANKRTDDIVAEMKGTKRSWLGRIYRATLIDTPSYLVGLMIKRNWLRPADISVLS